MTIFLTLQCRINFIEANRSPDQSNIWKGLRFYSIFSYYLRAKKCKKFVIG